MIFVPVVVVGAAILISACSRTGLLVDEPIAEDTGGTGGAGGTEGAGGAGGTAEECVEGSTRPLPYSGPAWTENVGICRPPIEECQVMEDGTKKYVKIKEEILPGDDICNGLDDNCDGQEDEDFNVGEDCYAGIGECFDDGHFVCTQSGILTTCDAKMKPPSEEICDGLDNNCDGLIDDGISCCDPDKDGIITDQFKDPNFLKAVREALGKGPDEDITLEDAINLTDLNILGKKVSSLSGIECFINLKMLDAHGNQIEDISPLARLYDLDWLNLSNNKIKDISALADAYQLTWLALDQNLIEDLEPLAGLYNLNWLFLTYNLIKDITPLINNSNDGGLGEGDEVWLTGNDQIPPKQIEELKANGVTVYW